MTTSREAPHCWVCREPLRRVNPRAHVGGWLVCARCWLELAERQLFGEPGGFSDHDWLARRDLEVESFTALQKEETERWLRTQVGRLLVERVAGRR